MDPSGVSSSSTGFVPVIRAGVNIDIALVEVCLGMHVLSLIVCG